MEIQTPLLRLLLLYYGNLSIQLRPVYWNNWRSVANVLWNSSFIVLIYIIIFNLTNPNNDQVRQVIVDLKRKPLFELLYKLGLQFAFPIAYGLSMVYFVVLNICTDELIPLLDSFHVESFFSQTKAVRKFRFIIVVNFFIYGINLMSVLSEVEINIKWTDGSAVEIGKLVLFIVGYYALNMNLPIVLGVVQYYKGATHHSLRQIKAKLNNHNVDIAKIELELRNLAQLNNRLNHLLSLPLMIIIFIYVFDIVILLSFLSFQYINLDMQNSLYTIMLTVHLSIIAFRQKCIDHQLTCIEAQLEGYHLKANDRQSRRMFRVVTWKWSLYQQDQESVQIRSRQIVHIYRKYFHLRLFNLCRVDLKFWCYAAVFIVNYVVLVTQTNV